MKDAEKTVSALDVSHYLLSLDPKRKYFTSKLMSSKEDWGINPPIEGNFRLNKLLHILQILYYVLKRAKEKAKPKNDTKKP